MHSLFYLDHPSLKVNEGIYLLQVIYVFLPLLYFAEFCFFQLLTSTIRIRHGENMTQVISLLPV